MYAAMAKTKSAKKANRAASRKRVFNVRRKKDAKDTFKDVSKLIASKNAADAAKSLPALYKALDKASKNGTIKKNTASRIKSRITKRVAAIAK